MGRLHSPVRRVSVDHGSVRGEEVLGGVDLVFIDQEIPISLEQNAEVRGAEQSEQLH